MGVVPSQPYMCSSSYSQAKMPPRSTMINQDLQNTSCSCVLQRESFPEMNDKFSCLKTQIRTFARENTTYIVWFKWKQSIEFSV